MRQTCAQKAAREVRWLIEQSKVSGVLKRQTMTSADSFYGPHKTTEAVIAAQLPIEIEVGTGKGQKQDPSVIGVDLLANVLPNSGVLEQDIIEVGSLRYRVTEVKPFNYFGTVTHIGLRLILERRFNG